MFPRIRHPLRAVGVPAKKLLRFIVEGDAINLMHKDIKMENMFVTKMHDLDQASLAVGDFGGAQIGEETVSGPRGLVSESDRAGQRVRWIGSTYATSSPLAPRPEGPLYTGHRS